MLYRQSTNPLDVAAEKLASQATSATEKATSGESGAATN
jgi:hypothetical protein